MSEERQKIRHKWGFGMSPISSIMEERYLTATVDMREILFLKREADKNYLGSISEFKGMLNRCIKQDQWDWFSVWMRMGHPPPKLLKRILPNIIALRKSIKEKDFIEEKKTISRLTSLKFEKILENFLGKNTESQEAGWIYILSTRENPSLLKIGMTTRDVVTRVREINSATGVVYPYSVRSVYKVNNPHAAEQSIFNEFSGFRVRNDREFFELNFFEARDVIREHLKTEGFLVDDWVNV